MPFLLDDVVTVATTIEALAATLGIKGKTQHLTYQEADPLATQYGVEMIHKMTVDDINQLSPTYLPALYSLVTSNQWWGNQLKDHPWILKSIDDDNRNIVNPESRVYRALYNHALWVCLSVDRARFTQDFAFSMKGTTNYLRQYGVIVEASKSPVAQEFTKPLFRVLGIDFTVGVVLAIAVLAFIIWKKKKG